MIDLMVETIFYTTRLMVGMRGKNAHWPKKLEEKNKEHREKSCVIEWYIEEKRFSISRVKFSNGKLIYGERERERKSDIFVVVVVIVDVDVKRVITYPPPAATCKLWSFWIRALWFIMLHFRGNSQHTAGRRRSRRALSRQKERSFLSGFRILTNLLGPRPS